MRNVAALAGLGCVAALTLLGQGAPANKLPETALLLQQAQSRLDAGDFAAAERLVEEAWQAVLARQSVDGESSWPLRVQEVTGFEQTRGKERAAERRMREALAAAPVAGEHRRTLGIMLGHLLLAQRRPLEARRALEAADQDPSGAYPRQLLRLLADAQEQTGDLAGAEATLRRKLALREGGPGGERELQLMTWWVSCGGTPSLGLNAPVNELAEFFARNERPLAARRELERAAMDVPATASLAERARPALGLLTFLASAPERRADAWALFERLLAMARAAPALPPTASALEMESDPAYLLRISLAEVAAHESGDRNRGVEVYLEALAPLRARNAPERRPSAAWSLSALLSEVGRKDEGQEWFRWLTSRQPTSPAPAAAAAGVLPLARVTPTVRASGEEAGAAVAPYSKDRLDRASIEQIDLSNGAEAARFLKRFAKELILWDEHHPRVMQSFYDRLARQDNGERPAAAYQAARRRIAERSMALPAMLEFYPDNSDDAAVLGGRLKLLEAVEGPNSRAVLQTARGLAEALDGDGDDDDDEKQDRRRRELWPKARLYWERAVQLTKRHYGEGSRQYKGVLDEFADAADWAGQPELAAQLAARAAAVKPGTE